jgi:hypothetical protein
MFRRLKREHGVRFYLAHNMTVTPGNVDQIAGVIRRCRMMGYSMFSFQPAAYVGDDRRWTEDYTALDPDRIWSRIEEGAGTRLPFRHIQLGDERCNRTAFGFYLGDRWHSVLDDHEAQDLATRDAFFRYFGGVHFNAPLHLLALRVVRVIAAHPEVVPISARWVRRRVHRAGGPSSFIRHRVIRMSFVMHRFMHASDVQPAWELLERGEMSDDPRIRETQERLQACSYAMAHPETGSIVPACVQHSVLDPEENRRLRVELPIVRVTTAPTALGAAQRT